MASHRQTGVTRRNLAIGSAAGVTGATIARQTSAANTLTRSRMHPAEEWDAMFGSRKLVVVGPAYMEPHLNEFFLNTFAEAHGVDVEWLPLTFGEESYRYLDYIEQEESGVDVLYATESVITDFGAQLMEDITGEISEESLEDLLPSALKAFQFQDIQYGIPFDGSVSIFIWNKQMYEDAGLDPETPPQDWTEFIEFSAQLTSGDRYGTYFLPNFTNFSILVNSTGGAALSDDLRTVLIETPENLLALQAIADLFESGAVDPKSLEQRSPLDISNDFQAGSFAHMHAMPPEYARSLDPDRSEIVGEAMVSIGPGIVERSGTINGSSGFAINRFSQNKDLALAFLEHTISQPVQEYTALTWGRPPASITTLENEEVLEASPHFAAVREQGEFVARRYGGDFHRELDIYYGEELVKLARGEQGVVETAAAIKESAQAKIDQFWDRVDG